MFASLPHTELDVINVLYTCTPCSISDNEYTHTYNSSSSMHHPHIQHHQRHHPHPHSHTLTSWFHANTALINTASDLRSAARFLLLSSRDSPNIMGDSRCARRQRYSHTTAVCTCTNLLTAPLHAHTPPPPPTPKSSNMSLCSLVLLYAGYTQNVYGSDRDDHEMIVWDSDTIVEVEKHVRREKTKR